MKACVGAVIQHSFYLNLHHTAHLKLFNLQRRTCDGFLHHRVVGIGKSVLQYGVFLLRDTNALSACVSHLIAAAVIEKLTSVSAVQRFDKGNAELFNLCVKLLAALGQRTFALAQLRHLTVAIGKPFLMRHHDQRCGMEALRILIQRRQRVCAFLIFKRRRYMLFHMILPEFLRFL